MYIYIYICSYTASSTSWFVVGIESPFMDIMNNRAFKFFFLNADYENGCLFQNCKDYCPRQTILNLESCLLSIYSFQNNLKRLNFWYWICKYNRQIKCILRMHKRLHILPNKYLSRFHLNWGSSSNCRLELLPSFIENE